MNDDELMKVFRSATRSIMPTDRLEALQGPGTADRQPPDRGSWPVLKAAGALVVVGALILILIGYGQRRPHPATERVASGTTTTADASGLAKDEIGGSITVARSTLPKATSFDGETVQPGGRRREDFSSPDLPPGTGVTLRVQLQPVTLIDGKLPGEPTNAKPTTVQGQRGSKGIARPAEISGLRYPDRPAAFVAWARTPTSMVLLTAQGIDVAHLEAIAETVKIKTDLVTVSGTLALVGGPPPGDPAPIHGIVRFTAKSRSSFSVETDPHGHFSTTLPAGTYALDGRSPQYGGGRAGACHGPTTDIARSPVTDLLVACRIK